MVERKRKHAFAGEIMSENLLNMDRDNRRECVYAQM